MEERRFGFFALTPKTIMLAMSPVLMLLALFAWLILGSAVVTAKKDSPPPATLHSS